MICEIMNDDGSMARLPRPARLRPRTRPQDRHHRRPDPLPRRRETLVERVVRRRSHGARRIQLHAYVDRASGDEAPGAGQGRDPAGRRRWCASTNRSRSSTSSIRAASAHLLDRRAQAALAAEGHGVIVLMHRPEDGEELLARLTAARLDAASSQVGPAIYGIGAQILRDLGVTQDAPALQPAPDALHDRLRPRSHRFRHLSRGALSACPVSTTSSRYDRRPRRHRSADRHRHEPLQPADLRRPALGLHHRTEASRRRRWRHGDRQRAGRAGNPARPADHGAERPLRRPGRPRRRHPRRHLSL